LVPENFRGWQKKNGVYNLKSQKEKSKERKRKNRKEENKKK
jgi:hypothetical protein